MSYDGIDRVQAIALDMLDELDRVCKAIGVEYFLIGGTALGAVRHAGFIPWDDDIDVGMVRADYEKFLAYAKDELRPEYFLQTPETDPHVNIAFAKLRRNGTTFRHWSERKLRMHPGIFLDVFPYDNIPDDKSSRLRQYILVQALVRLFQYKRMRLPQNKRHGIAALTRAVLRSSVHVITKIIPAVSILKMLNRGMTRYDACDTDAMACLFFPKFLIEYMRRDTLFPLSNIEFCGRVYPCPNDMHTYLTTHYGNYMELPPEHQRANHKPHVLDTGTIK
jgi:lipopolysaccharide cholinephosphotransferase